MHLRHKWSDWGEIEDATIRWRPNLIVSGQEPDAPGYLVVALVQRRHCHSCGVIQTKAVRAR